MAALCWLAPPARGEPLPPLRVPNLAIGTRCFGFLPCTGIDPFGLRLRFGALAVFRPEKGHDRDLYAARIQIMPAITLMKWAELGVAIPITLYKKGVGVSTVPEPIEPYGRLRIPSEGLLAGASTTAFVRLRIASGPFVGGIPSLPYQRQTEFDAGLVMSKRIGPMTATGSLGTSVAPGHVEIYGGGELACRAFQIVQIFVQGQGSGIPKCRPDEAELNFCARAFRFGAGVRFDWDLGSGGILIGTASGGAEVGWMVGAQMGLDYDETTRRRHGDGVEAAQAWWDRRFAAMARGWAEWKSAAAFWHEEEAARRVRPSRGGRISSLLGDALLPPSSPWLDALLDDALPQSTPLFDAEGGVKPAAAGARPVAAQAPKSKASRRHPRRSLLAETDARAALARRLAYEPRFVLPGSLDLMTDEELARSQWQILQEELRRTEAQRWQESPSLPPVSKSIINGLARVPYGMVSPFLMGSPEGATKMAELWERLRPVKYTPEEQRFGETMEEIVSFAGEVAATAGAGSLLKAETAGVRVAMRAGARQAAAQAGRQAAFEAAEQATLGAAENLMPEASQLGGSRVSQLLARLNPMNYRVCGVSCGAGGIEFKPPPVRGSATQTAEVLEGNVGSVTEQSQPAIQTQLT